MRLLTEEELAQDFGLPVHTIRRYRRSRGWPHVRLNRLEVRFTEQQVEQIVRMQSEAQTKPTQQGKKLPGQTDLSAARGGAK